MKERIYPLPYPVELAHPTKGIIDLPQHIDGEDCFVKFVNGAYLFELQATHGLPLCMSLDKFKERALRVFWPSYIERARDNNWGDYKIVETIDHGLIDAEFDQRQRDNILDRIKKYVMRYPHPDMNNEDDYMPEMKAYWRKVKEDE